MFQEYDRKEIFTKNLQEQYVLETLVFENVVIESEGSSGRSLQGTPAKSMRSEASTPFTLTPAKSARTNTSVNMIEDSLLQSNKRQTGESSHNNSKSSGITAGGSNPTSPTRMIEKDLSSILGFQTKFITFSIENTSLQFSIALRVSCRAETDLQVARPPLREQKQPVYELLQGLFAEVLHAGDG